MSSFVDNLFLRKPVFVHDESPGLDVVFPVLVVVLEFRAVEPDLLLPDDRMVSHAARDPRGDFLELPGPASMDGEEGERFCDVQGYYFWPIVIQLVSAELFPHQFLYRDSLVRRLLEFFQGLEVLGAIRFHDEEAAPGVLSAPDDFPAEVLHEPEDFRVPGHSVDLREGEHVSILCPVLRFIVEGGGGLVVLSDVPQSGSPVEVPQELPVAGPEPGGSAQAKALRDGGEEGWGNGPVPE